MGALARRPTCPMARNSDVSPYIGKLSRSKLYSKKGLYKREHKAAAPSDKAEAKEETAYYPADDVRKPKASRKSLKPTKLRASITPGTVLILLASRFRGKRVVFLKQLPSGLLLVSGPFKINGVPLRRINQAYVIATSTKVDISRVTVDDKINDAYFTKEASKRSKGSEKEFFGADGKKGAAAEKKEKKEFPADKSGDKKSVDKALLAAINKTENLAKYLGSTFSLSKGQYPHQMQF